MKKSSLFLLLLLPAMLLISCYASPVVQDKIKGVSYVASHDTIAQNHIDPLLKINATHTAVIPYGFIRDTANPEVIYNTERQWYGERREGVKQAIEQLHNNNIKVMLKPHLWIWRGEFTGDMLLPSEAAWKQFEDSYAAYILLYAKLAQEENVEILCIGTELYNFTNARPAFWRKLIKDVREVYTGKITYAENWDKVDKVQFWEDLDYIGADAYFPVSMMQTPTIADAKKGWKTHKELLALLSRKRNKPILFTEYGYRSSDFAGREPWTSERHDGKMNTEAQENLYEALFETFWNEPWFAGGFSWKWFHDHDRTIQQENNRFTPQGKPAEAVMKKWYAQ